MYNTTINNFNCSICEQGMITFIVTYFDAKYYITINESTFSHNQALSGGALYLKNRFLIENNFWTSGGDHKKRILEEIDYTNSSISTVNRARKNG